MRRYLAGLVSLGVIAVLIYVAQVPSVLSAFQQINLAPGDTLTINCSTVLSGEPSGQNATFNCAPNATGTSTPTATATPQNANSQTVTFGGLSNPNRPLTGQYPNGVIDWGGSDWWLSAPWGKFTSNSISFNGDSLMSASFTFVTPRRLIQLDAFNGGTDASTVFVHCDNQPVVQANLSANQLATIATGWTNACSIVTIASSNGWQTNFDSLVIDAGVSAKPSSTPTSTSTSTVTPTRTPTATATRTPTPGRACPCSIFASNSAPAGSASSDTRSVEVGVKFRSDADGFITGIRFYKFSVNTGPHVGSLWSSSGTLLAQAPFANESASGWQQVTFSSPVAIHGNTTYIASYHTAGHYAADRNFFASGVDNAPLHALADGADGGDGVYAYSSTPAFPISTFRASNYWVDVVFHP